MKLSRSLMRRLSGLRRRSPGRRPEAGPRSEAPAGPRDPSDVNERPAGPRDPATSPLEPRVDRIYELPPYATRGGPPASTRPGTPSPDAPPPDPPPPDGHPPALPGAGISRPSPASVDRRAPRTTWSLPVLASPPPFLTAETARGSVRIRRFTVSVPDHLREALSRNAARLRGGGVTGRTIVLDTETTGFGSATLFLVGLAWFDGAGIGIEQVLAPNQSREAALLMRLYRHWQHAGRFVTYNGRSYDLPLVRDRATRHRLPPFPSVPDLDLLTLARRRWRHELPDCRLATIEGQVLGRPRRGDVPGAEIPALYRDSVRTESTRLLAPVLHHNALDVLTTMELLPMLDDGREEEDREKRGRSAKGRKKSGTRARERDLRRPSPRGEACAGRTSDRLAGS